MIFFTASIHVLCILYIISTVSPSFYYGDPFYFKSEVITRIISERKKIEPCWCEKFRFDNLVVPPFKTLHSINERVSNTGEICRMSNEQLEAAYNDTFGQPITLPCAKILNSVSKKIDEIVYQSIIMCLAVISMFLASGSFHLVMHSKENHQRKKAKRIYEI